MLVAGLMSGTSADGIDVAFAGITGFGWKTRVRLQAFETVAYRPDVRRKILDLAGGGPVSVADISQMNFLLGELFSSALQTACRRAKIDIAEIELIGSHGQTIYHQPVASRLHGLPVRSTLQIGEPSVIAARTGITTVGDFRPADVAAGGQGAPLVPFFDYLLFRHPRRGRIALNIGGIANLTAIPAGGSEQDVIAFDTGPGNMLVDRLAILATRGKAQFDKGGRLASQGRVAEQVVTGLMRQAYFRKPPPKTTGREQYGTAYLEKYFLRRFGTSRQGMCDALATAGALTAESIVHAIPHFILPRFAVADVIVSGGGARNPFLIQEIGTRLLKIGQTVGPAIRLMTSDAAGIPANAKEAVAFAVLAYHTIHRKPSNLGAATGAAHPAILGKVAYGR